MDSREEKRRDKRIYMLDCPVCPRKIIDDSKCPQCGTDLTPLLRLRELPDLYYIDGVHRAEQGQLNKAIESLMTAISLNSGHTSPYIALGNIYVQKGLYEDAILHYEKALQIDPANEEVKKAKDEAEGTRNQLRETQLQQTNKIATFKKLLIGIPVITFFIGVITLSVIQNFIKQSPGSRPVDFSAITEQIKRNISNYPALSSFNIEVTQTNKGLSISGEVPTDLHKNLITEIAKNVAGNNTVDMQNLLIVPLREKVPEFLYTVKTGDTLSLIAYRFYGDSKMWNRIYDANRNKITEANRISIGEIISIPNK